MPNKHSNAGHTPMRTCVVCRAKSAQSELLSFFLLDHELVFDLDHSLMRRKQYLCRNTDCYAGLAKWKKRVYRKHGKQK